MTTSLKALAESKTDGIQKATYFKLDPSVVTFEEGFNLREEGPELDDHIARIAAAMREGAYLPPIDVAVVDGVVVARDGHCRTRAAMILKDEGIDYMLEARQVRGNEADAVFHMLGSDARKSFSPLEVGRGYARLVAFGQTPASIAKKLGVSRSRVENGLALAEAPVAVQALVTSGKVASHLALKTLKTHGPKAAEKLTEAIVAAEAAGKKKATAKHITKPLNTEVQLQLEQPFSPAGDILEAVALLKRVADISIISTHLDRAVIAAIVIEVRAYLGGV